jgi:nitrilase
MDLLKQANLDFDVYGHYSRPDIFSLHVDTRAKQVVKLQTEDSGE